MASWLELCFLIENWGMGKDLKNNQALKDISLFLKKDREEYAYEIGKEKKAEIRQIFLDFIGGLCTSSGW